MKYLNNSYDVQFLFGMHAMGNATEGNLRHTYSRKWIRTVWVNGQPMGEIGFNLLNEGYYGVPTVFVSGDLDAVNEAKALVPNIEGVAVKESVGINSAICLAPQKAQELIRSGAKRAMEKVGKISPFFIEPPYVVRVEYQPDDLVAERGGETFIDRNARYARVQRIDTYTLEMEPFTDWIKCYEHFPLCL